MGDSGCRQLGVGLLRYRGRLAFAFAEAQNEGLRPGKSTARLLGPGAKRE